MLISYLLYLIATLILRVHYIDAMGFSEAWKQGLPVGIYYDIFICTLPWILAQLLSFNQRILRYALLTFFSSFLWVSVLANNLYFHFFESKLYWWVVSQHWEDVTAVGDSTTSLVSNVWLMSSFVFFVLFLLSLTLSFFSRKSFLSNFGFGFGFGKKTIVTIILAVVVLHFQQLPLRYRMELRNWLASPYNVTELRSVVYDHVLIQWMTDWDPRGQSFSTQGSVRLKNVSAAESKHPDKGLATYLKRSQLLQKVNHSPSDTKAWRELLGLPKEGPLNVVLFFVESFRAYEFLNPSTARTLYPNLLKVVDEKGLLYEQYYTSVSLPGQTVRGIFSTQCSFIENLLGPGTYLANPQLRIRCLAQILAEKNYNSLWFANHPTHFHNKGAFELSHGIQQVFEPKDFLEPKQIPKQFLHLKDSVSYPALVKKMKEILPTKEPFYLHTINIGTHHPFGLYPNESLPSRLRKNKNLSSLYKNYLKSIKVFDREFTQALLELMKQDWAKRTIFIVAADHSIPIELDTHESAVSREEQKFRIPLIVFSNGLKKGLRFKKPIHQIDLAPTLLSILGLDAEEAFMGSALPAKDTAGSPWFFTDPGRLSSWRDNNLVCHAVKTTAQCYQYQEGQDPLFAPMPSALPYDTKHAAEVQKLAELIYLTLGKNQVLSRDFHTQK